MAHNNQSRRLGLQRITHGRTCPHPHHTKSTLLCTAMMLQVVLTTIEPRGGRRGSAYDAYEYIANSHTYLSDNQPTAKFSYKLSAVQVGRVTTHSRTFLG
jgi:hypothetical protein